MIFFEVHHTTAYYTPFERSWWAFFKNAIFFALAPPGGHLGSKMAAEMAKTWSKCPGFYRITYWYLFHFCALIWGKQYLKYSSRALFSIFDLRLKKIVIYLFILKTPWILVFFRIISLLYEKLKAFSKKGALLLYSKFSSDHFDVSFIHIALKMAPKSPGDFSRFLLNIRKLENRW